MSPDVRSVSAGLALRSVTPSLQSGLSHLGREELVVMTSLQPLQLLPGGQQLLAHLLQPEGDLGLGGLGLEYSLPESSISILKISTTWD